jgi:predicted nuclease of predicted toxin-antitoxin system
MKFFVDENVSRRIAERLERDGHLIVYGQDVAHGAQDVDVLALALAQGAIVLTEDTDFGDLVMRQHRPSAGVLLLRLSGMARSQQPDYVAQTIAAHAATIAGSFTVVTRSPVRTRSLP